MIAYYVVDSGKRIEPFGEYQSGCLIANQTLAEHRLCSLKKLGVSLRAIECLSELDCDQEYLVFGENLYFTPEFIAWFLRAARRRGTVCVCGLNKDITVQRMGMLFQKGIDHPFYHELNLRYYPPIKQRKANENAILISCDQHVCRIPIPEHMCGSSLGYAVPMTNLFAIEIDHWVNLWSANILTCMANVARIKKSWYLKTIPWKVLRNLNTIGKGCRIHKKAYVEASVIGDNVTIEPGAIVKASIIGDNVHIGNGVIIEESVLGQGCTILHGHILFSCFGPQSFSVSNFVSACITGRRAFIGANTTFCDFRFDGKNVLAYQDGKKMDTGNRFLGVCLGHDVYIGGGCTIAPGRVVRSGSALRQAYKRIYSNSTHDWKGFEVARPK